MIPVSLTRAFGIMVRDTRQGTVLLSVMAVLWGAMLAVIWTAEGAAGVMEGKEIHFGIPA